MNKQAVIETYHSFIKGIITREERAMMNSKYVRLSFGSDVPSYILDDSKFDEDGETCKRYIDSCMKAIEEAISRKKMPEDEVSYWHAMGVLLDNGLAGYAEDELEIFKDEAHSENDLESRIPRVITESDDVIYDNIIPRKASELDRIMRNTKIDDYITSLTLQDECRKSRDDHINKEIGLMSYMKKTFGAETYGDVLQLFEKAQVGLKVMRFLISEGYVDALDKFNRVYKGYPEFRNLLEKSRAEMLAKVAQGK